MRIQVLVDNRTLRNELKSEHGLSIYVETDVFKCLLDTGNSDLFIKNANSMEIDLAEVDYVFISHGHVDHIGGLSSFLKINAKAKVLISKNAVEQHFFSIRKGLKRISSDYDFSIYADRFIYIDAPKMFENDIQIFPCTTKKYVTPLANKTLMKELDSERVADNFNHELVFVYGKEKLFVYTGCAHKGVLNILDSVDKYVGKPIRLLAGGFHLVDDFETEDEITDIAQICLSKYPNTTFITGHCTGNCAYTYLKAVLGNNLYSFYTGFTLIDNNI
mgnify:CR=1 FL=1